MADFGVNATSLSAPSGAGSQPVSYTPVNLPANNTVGLLGGVVDMFAKGIGAAQEIKAQEAKNSILSQISQKEAALNQGLQNGEITANEASTRSRANFNQFLASYPGLATEIGGIYNTFKGTTETGVREEGLKAQRDRAAQFKASQEDDLRKSGFLYTPQSSEQEFTIMSNALQLTRQADKQFADMKDKVKWQQEQQGWTQQQTDRQLKQESIGLLNNIAGGQLSSLGAELTSLQKGLKSGSVTYEQGSVQLEQRFANIFATLTSAASASDPALANSYKPLFDGLQAVGRKMLDPKADSEKLAQELKDTLNRTQLAIIQSDPKTRSLAAISQLFGNNQPILTADYATKISEAMLKSGAVPVANGQTNGFVPQIVGDPDIESGALAGLREGIKQLQTGNPKNKEAANIEGSNSVNNILVQTGKAIDNGASPQSLKGLAGFFAGSEYAYMVQKGQIDPTAAAAAKKTFQLIYEPAVVSSLGTKLQDKVEMADGKTAPLAAQVDVKWNGAGFVFEAAKGSKAVDAITGLKTAEAGLTQLVRLGAHMEGTTNYEQYWEKNKHLFLPSVYPDPARLKVGEVVQGRKYIGGNVSNPSNWVLQIPK